MIYTIKTTSGREDIVSDILSSKIKAQALDIKAILHPTELKGYVFIEGNIGDIHKAIQGMLHVKGLMEKPVNLEEIQRFFETKKVTVDIGDEVEIIGGGFKGERGIISRVDITKEEVTVELREGSIPIPVTVPNELVKLLKKAVKKEGEQEIAPKPKKISLDDLRGDLSEEPKAGGSILDNVDQDTKPEIVEQKPTEKKVETPVEQVPQPELKLEDPQTQGDAKKKEEKKEDEAQ